MNHFEYLSPDGELYSFYKMIQEHSNLGLPNLKFIEDSGPQQHGVNVRDWRINPRTITLKFFKDKQQRGKTLYDIINTIRPNRGESSDNPGWLRVYNDAYKKLEIPVFPLGGPSGDFAYGGNIGRLQVDDVIQFYASDPIWREVDQKSITVVSNEGGLCLPSCLYSSTLPAGNGNAGCLVPQSYMVQSLTINYGGTWVGDQIDIILTGPIDQPTIVNQTTNKIIELNYNIASGDYVIITIRPEYSTVLHEDGTNLIGTVTSISDLFDFNLVTPGAISPTGENRISVAGVSQATSNSKVEIKYYIRHISAYVD